MVYDTAKTLAGELRQSEEYRAYVSAKERAMESGTTRAPGGVCIACDRLGDPAARAVVFLHGGGQTRRSWGKAAAAVAERGWQAVTVDLRGHGESDWSGEGDVQAEVKRMCDTLLANTVIEDWKVVRVDTAEAAS